MKNGLIILCFLFSTPYLKAQNIDSIYNFLNQTIRMSFLESTDVRSDWGLFLLSSAYPVDDYVCKWLQIDTTREEMQKDSMESVFVGFTITPPAVLKAFYDQCIHIDTAWQHQFKWQQNRIEQFIVVTGYREHLSTTKLNGVKLNAREKKAAISYIKEWNKSPVEDRLVHYSSIPLFSDDGKYVLVVRGQNAGSHGWDSIFIYKRTNGKWSILESVQLSTI